MRTVSTALPMDLRAAAAMPAAARRSPGGSQRSGDGRDAVAVLDRLRARAHGVQDGSGLVGGEVL